MIRSVTITLLIISLFQCRAPVEVYQNRDETYFRQDHTYGFMEVDIDNQTDLEPYQPHLDLLQSAIASELEARGYSPSDSPDLFVNIGIVLTEEEATRETTIQEAPLYAGQRNYSWKSEEVVYDVYKQGVLVVDLVDSRSNELVWKGVGKRVLPKKQEKRAELIRKSVEDLFRQFPAPTS